MPDTRFIFLPTVFRPENSIPEGETPTPKKLVGTSRSLLIQCCHNISPDPKSKQVSFPSASNFNSTISNTAIDGANALKLDNEISSNVSEELPTQTQEVILESKDEEKNSLILENEYNEEEKTSNGLENFQLEDDTPELFDSGNTLETESNDQEFSSFVKEQNEDEDELEIPAFLRRQNN